MLWVKAAYDICRSVVKSEYVSGPRLCLQL